MSRSWQTGSRRTSATTRPSRNPRGTGRRGARSIPRPASELVEDTSRPPVETGGVRNRSAGGRPGWGTARGPACHHPPVAGRRRTSAAGDLQAPGIQHARVGMGSHRGAGAAHGDRCGTLAQRVERALADGRSANADRERLRARRTPLSRFMNPAGSVRDNRPGRPPAERRGGNSNGARWRTPIEGTPVGDPSQGQPGPEDKQDGENGDQRDAPGKPRRASPLRMPRRATAAPQLPVRAGKTDEVQLLGGAVVLIFECVAFG